MVSAQWATSSFLQLVGFEINFAIASAVVLWCCGTMRAQTLKGRSSWPAALPLRTDISPPSLVAFASCSRASLTTEAVARVRDCRLPRLQLSGCSSCSSDGRRLQQRRPLQQVDWRRQRRQQHEVPQLQLCQLLSQQKPCGTACMRACLWPSHLSLLAKQRRWLLQVVVRPFNRSITESLHQ